MIKNSWKEVDIGPWERKGTYHAFKNFDFPWLVVGANLSLGRAVEFWRDQKISSYLATVYAFRRAANSISAFKQRMHGDRVIEHETVHADYTVPAGKESFSIRMVPYSPSFADFLNSVKEMENSALASPGFVNDVSDHGIFMSCLPWVQITHVVQPVSRSRAATVPRIVWGRFFEDNGSWKIPVSVQAHHSVVDGIHMSKLFQEVESIFAQPSEIFG